MVKSSHCRLRMSLMRKPVRQANREAAFRTGMSQGVAARLLHFVQCQILFLYVLWLKLIKVVIDVFTKPFVPIGNLQQSSESRVVAGCRIEGYGAIAVFELLDIQ